MTAAEQLHGDDYARGARYDFAVNVSDDPHPPWLEAAVARGVRQLGRYPDDRAASAAVARRHGRDPADVVLLNGSAEAFTLIARALRPRRPLIVHPSFTEPERALHEAQLRPGRLILAPPFELDPAAVPDDADLVIVGNPTNPTGALHSRNVLTSLCRPDRTTVVDEAFIEFVPGERESLARAGEAPGLVVVRSLTKALGVPGVRAGYLLAPAPLAARLRSAAPRWSVNAVALAVVEAAMERQAYFDEQANRTAGRRARLVAALRTVDGIRSFPASANFLLLEVPDAVAAQRRLRSEYGIATRPCWQYPGLDQRHLRVAVRGEPLDRRLVAALTEIVAPRR